MPRIVTGVSGLGDLAGGAHVALLQRHLLHLRDAYSHGNRKLFYDELVTAYLLAFFNPAARSLRTIEDLSVAEAPGLGSGRAPGLGVPGLGADGLLQTRKLCRSTMSDANALMDARLLEPLIRRLQQRVRDLKKQDGQLARLLEQVRIIDGSFFASAATVAWALKSRNGPGKQRGGPFHFKVRLDLHLDGATRMPRRLSVNGTGTSEAASAGAQVEPYTIHITDRGFTNLKYIDGLLNANADFVLRVKQQAPNFQSRED